MARKDESQVINHRTGQTEDKIESAAAVVVHGIPSQERPRYG